MIGGDKRDRTADLLNAIQALSQLSYIPKVSIKLTKIFVFVNTFLKSYLTFLSETIVANLPATSF